MDQFLAHTSTPDQPYGNRQVALERREHALAMKRQGAPAAAENHAVVNTTQAVETKDGLLCAAAAPRALLFLDLDGVLADFDGGVVRVTGKQPGIFALRDGCSIHAVRVPAAACAVTDISDCAEHQSASEMWRKLARSERFFATLGWTRGCGEVLWRSLAPFGPCILTGLPRGTWAEPQKREWCKKRLGAEVQVLCCLSKDKKSFAARCVREGRDAILVDDRLSNCEQWRSVGGIAVHHTSLEKTLRQLSDLGFACAGGGDAGQIERRPRRDTAFEASCRRVDTIGHT